MIDNNSILTRAIEPGTRLTIPLNSYEGNWTDSTGKGRPVVRYTDDPNGSQGQAAAVANDEGNVVGIMPHPERAIEEVLGSTDGQVLLESYLSSLVPA